VNANQEIALVFWCVRRQCRLAAAAAGAALCVLQGQTAIRNVYNWRVKETERMVAIVTELGKLGAQVGRMNRMTVVPDVTVGYQASVCCFSAVVHHVLSHSS
jgi:5-enolpyruvylshikimate-3-phosphate synthase